MSQVVRRWLERDPDSSVLAVDAAAADAQARGFFAAVADRIEFLTADILDPSLWESLGRRKDVSGAVHGATVTSIDPAWCMRRTAAARDWAGPERVSTSTSTARSTCSSGPRRGRGFAAW